MSILGNHVRRVEDPRFLTDGARFVADLRIGSAAHVVFVRSTVANGRIDAVELDAARSSPGVLAVLSAADLDLGPYSNRNDEVLVRMPMPTARARFAGEPVVAVVAESLAEALDAAELVELDIEPLEAVTTIREALTDEVLVFEDLGTNVLAVEQAAEIDFSGCEIVIDAEIVNSRINAVPIETRVAAAAWGDDGRLTCWTSTQGAHPAQAAIRHVLGLTAEQVRIVTTDVGGSFGSKARPGPEECILGALAAVVGRPVVWAESRTENLLAMGNARSQLNRVKMGGTRDGRVTHYRLDITAEAGAYPEGVSFLPYFTRLMTTGVYDIPHTSCGWVTVATNTAPIVAFRGAGRPEATATIERAIDMFAAEVGLDPTEVRRVNMIAADEFPFTTPLGQVYDSGDYVAALDNTLTRAGYGELRREQATRREAGSHLLLGIGVASYVEITAPNPASPQSEHGSVTVMADGTVMARTGSTPYGQGHETTWAMIVADAMGVPVADIRVVWGDTDAIPSSGITGGSRSVQLAGSAMADAAARVIDEARRRAAALLEAATEDIVFDAAAGAFHVAGTPARAVGWVEVAAATDEPLTGVSEFSQLGATFPFGSHLAVVEVDVLTGGVELLRLVTTDDAGTLVNPLLAEGQIHGGVAAGAAQALFEEVVYDEVGNLTTASLADYAIPAATELPSFEIDLTETPTPLNPLGAKGIGEAGSVGSTPAVQNAVIDALAHIGVRHIDMPLTPSKVWSSYSNATAASPV